MEWISVKDRLPEKNYNVLLITEWNCCYVGMLRDDNWVWGNGDCLCKEEVTHWMALPEPPKEMTADG